MTNVDTLNLEIALGARARNPDMPIVLRIAEAAFAASIADHFQLETTFSVAALAGPVFCRLSRLPGARGRIAFGGQEFGIAEIALSEDSKPCCRARRSRWRSAATAAVRAGAGLYRVPRAPNGLMLMRLAPFATTARSLNALPSGSPANLNPAD